MFFPEYSKEHSCVRTTWPSVSSSFISDSRLFVDYTNDRAIKESNVFKRLISPDAETARLPLVGTALVTRS